MHNFILKNLKFKHLIENHMRSLEGFEEKHFPIVTI